MKPRLRISILILLIILILGILYFANYNHPLAPTGEATLSWDKSSDSTVKGYRIYYGTAPRDGKCPPGGYASHIDTGSNTKYILKNLAAGKTYYFSVATYNTSGREGCFSQEMKKTISVPYWERLKDFFGNK